MTQLHKRLFAEEYIKLTEMGVSISSKDKHLTWLWKFIHHFLKIITFNKMSNFFTSFTTTIGKTICFYEGWSPENTEARDYVILRHEREHVEQYIRYGLGSASLGIFIMGFLYLLVFIPAVGSWFRYYFERNAYLEGIRAWRRLGINPDIERYVEILSGPNYIWAWPFKNSIRKYFTDNLSN